MPSRLTDGFASLTLDPSPRLRQVREDLAEADTLTQAWMRVAKALAEAARSLGQTLRR